jgi:hypothetical protein
MSNRSKCGYYAYRLTIVLAITMTSIFVLNTASTQIPLLKIQEASAHLDPGNCNSTGVAISLTVFRNNVALIAGAPLTAGETVEYGVTLTDPVDVGPINCAQDDGSITITDPNSVATIVDGVGDAVAPVRDIPCIGGSTNVGDTILPADCGNAITSFTSNRVSYQVDCRDTIGGQLRTSAEYDGLAHNNVNDANAAQISGSTEIANPCVAAVPTLTTQSNPSSSGLAPGVAVTDKATVTGVIGLAPTGTVTFFLCNPGQLTGGSCPSGGTQIGAAVPLNGAGMATSVAASGATTTPEGKYCWRAQYSGDANYNPLNHTNGQISGNGGECFNVGQVPLGTIIIKKDTVPNDPQDFSFTHNITSNPAVPSPFKLDDDSNPTLSNMRTFLDVPAGSYTVTEMTVPSIPLLSIICADPTGDSGRAGNSADIELDAGETVTCTFINGVQEAPCENGVLSVPQPEDAISMTTVRSGNIVKTIHAEKQIFDCDLMPDGVPVIADVTIIAEIYENISTKEVISKQVEVITCIKEESRGRVFECDLSIPSTDRIPVTNCTELPTEHPQEMNTVRKGATAKTIETQKEVFICTFADGPDSPTTPSPNDKKVDLVLFTDIFQNLNTLTSQDPLILSMKCVIKIDNVTVESCRFTNHPL